MSIQNFYSNGGLDKIGAAVSWVCAIHCLIAPVLVLSLPLVGLSFLASEGTEYFLIGLSVAVGAASLLPAFSGGIVKSEPCSCSARVFRW